jgi:phosphoheptose isomerase
MSRISTGSFIQAQLAASADLKHRAAERCTGDISAAATILIEAFRSKRKVLLCGNGGSAADCQHIAAEFVSALNHEHPRAALGAIALTTDTSFLTANANDFGFDWVFARQVDALAHPGDVLLAISTSGKSPNVVRALTAARAQGARTIVLTGEDGGEAGPLGDVTIRVPSRETQHIQECHIAIGHILCALVEQELFPR